MSKNTTILAEIIRLIGVHRAPTIADVLSVAPTAYDHGLPTEDAADFLGTTVAAMEQHRCRGTGPAYYQDGRHVAYRVADLVDYQAQCRVNPTRRGRPKNVVAL